MVDDDRLIDLVEVNDLIYNRCNLNYKSVDRKRKAWSAIAAELGVPDNDAIKRYRVLRDRFVKEKRVELLTGADNKYRPPIMEKLEFLTPHVFNRNSNGVKIAWSGKEPIPLNQSATLSNIDPLHWNPVTSDQDDYDDTTVIDVQYSVPTAQIKQPEIPPPSVPIKRKVIEQPPVHTDSTDVDDAFCDALRSFKKLCQTREERKGNEALSGFGQMIIATIAGMSTQKQTKAMLRVTEVVMQIKLEPDD